MQLTNVSLITIKSAGTGIQANVNGIDFHLGCLRESSTNQLWVLSIGKKEYPEVDHKFDTIHDAVEYIEKYICEKV